ncbi:MAG: lysophospholipid acyltransferase family protein [Desulfobacterales bacterium]
MNVVDRAIYRFFTLIGSIPAGRMHRKAALLGRIWFAVDRSHRRIALENLEKAFGSRLSKKEREALAKESFENLMRIPFEMGWAIGLDPDAIPSHFEVQGIQHAQEAMEKNKGLIVITGHTGNWELLCLLSAYEAIPFNIVYRPLDFAPLDRFIAGFRSRFGARLVPKIGSIKRLVSCLKRNEVIVLVMDQRVGRKEGLFIDFFGDVSLTTKGPAYLALLTGAPVLPVFIRRSGGGFVVEIGKEIPLFRSGDRTRDIAENTLKYNQAIESFIRKHPSQWMWVHRRWKIRGEAPSSYSSCRDRALNPSSRTSPVIRHSENPSPSSGGKP